LPVKKRANLSEQSGVFSPLTYKNIACLDFHHLDSTDKKDDWSNLRLKSWDKIIHELKKCILVCKNCHGELHYPNLYIQSINLDDNNFLNHTPKVLEPTGICPVCHANVYGTKYCSTNCSSLGHRKIKNRPSKEELEELIKEHSFLSLGKKFGVSDNSVRKWAKLYNLIK
jgi:hypothetical protein